MIGYIYMIRNLVNDKKYIGQTINPKARKIRHFGDLKAGIHDNPHLQKAFLKYGIDTFNFEVIDKIEFSKQSELDQLEIQYIKKYNSYLEGYNCNPGGQGEKANWSKFTDEDILNMCAVIKYLPHCGGVLSELYNTSNTTIYRLRHRLSNLEQTAKFDALPEEEQRAIYDKMCQEHNLVQKKYENMKWRQGRRQLDKNFVFLVYIYDEYGNGKRNYLAYDYGIKNNNVLRCIRNKTSYADFYEDYKQISLDEKLKILCHYMETYNRKPPELLGHLVKSARQSAAKSQK